MNIETMNQWKQYYLALVVFLLPWQAVWLFSSNESQYLRLGLYAIDVLMLVAITLHWREVRSFFAAYGRGLAVVLSYFILVSFFTPLPVVAIWKMATLLLIVVFAVLVRRRLAHETLVVSFVASGVLQGMIAIVQFFLQSIPASTILGMSAQLPSILGTVVVETVSGRWLRAYGTFPHPNILGGYLAIALIVAVDFYFRTYERFQAWLKEYGATGRNLWHAPEVRRTALHLALLLASIVIIFLGLLASYSRSALVAVIFAGAAYGIVAYQKNRIRATVLGIKLLAIFSALFIVWQMFFPGLWNARVIAVDRLERKSVTERVEGYGAAVNVFATHPFFGIGLSQYTAKLAINHPDQPSYSYQPVHNSFLLILAEIGMVGILVLVASFWYAKDALWQLWQRASLARFHAQPLFLALLLLLLTIGLFDHYLWSLHAGLLVLLIPFLFSLARHHTLSVANF